jgi:hypothetical protein
MYFISLSDKYHHIPQLQVGMMKVEIVEIIEILKIIIMSSMT